MDYKNKTLNAETLLGINKEVAYINQNHSVKSAGNLKEEIFEILKKVGSLIFYPIDEDDLWGIYALKDDKHYFVINSSISIEKQVFAAAHELAHSLDIAQVKHEMVTADIMTEYVNHKEHGKELENADLIANRFAAEILVGEKELRIKFIELSKKYDNITTTVLLSDYFLVPINIIIKRYIETGLLAEKIINKLYEIDDKTVDIIFDRYECRRRNILITNKKELGGYKDKALTLYENDLSTYKELKRNLSLLNKTPEDYNIYDDSLDINDYLTFAVENPDVEDTYDADE